MNRHPILTITLAVLLLAVAAAELAWQTRGWPPHDPWLVDPWPLWVAVARPILQIAGTAAAVLLAIWLVADRERP